MSDMVRRISHFGILVHDAAAAAKIWTEAFGFKKYRELEIEVEGIRSIFISAGGTADEMTIEIMEPLDKSDMSNALARRLASAGEGFYHVCIEVEDVETSAKELAERGMTVLMRDPAAGQAARRWLVHPRDANGVMVEAVQS